MKFTLTPEILCYFFFFFKVRPHETLAIYRMKREGDSLSTINACERVTLISASSLLCWRARTQELTFMVYIIFMAFWS